MRNLITPFSLLLIFTLTSCNLQTNKIHYGEDGCHFCSMTIVDQQHAAQLVTKKGKVYKFDAAECMINSLSDFDEETIAQLLVTDYETPGQLIDATSATFIISPEIPSPMRANLSASISIERARTILGAREGELLNWQEIQLYLKNQQHVRN
jgi:copper chaperone NosL